MTELDAVAIGLVSIAVAATGLLYGVYRLRHRRLRRIAQSDLGDASG